MDDGGGGDTGGGHRPPCYFDDNLTFEVLSYLPLADVKRFQCVSRRWHDLISSQHFRRMHARRCNETFSGFFHVTLHNEGGQIGYVPIPTWRTTGDRVDPPAGLNHLAGKRVSLAASCNEFLLLWIPQLEKRLWLWNTSTGDFAGLPDPTFGRSLRFGIQAASLSTSYKIACFSWCYVAVLDSAERRWRTWAQRVPDFPMWSVAGGLNLMGMVNVRGRLHWLADCGKIVALHLAKEEVRVMKSPPPPQGLNRAWLAAVGEQLHLIQVVSGENATSWAVLWLLEDYDEMLWTRSVPPFWLPKRTKPLLFDGRWLFLGKKDEVRATTAIIAYDTKTRRSAYIDTLPCWLDNLRSYLPYINKKKN